MRTYSVNLFIKGPVSIMHPLSFEADKELQLGALFRSHLEIRPGNRGLRTSCTAHTENKERALRVAMTFLGRMLDVLSFRTNMPITVSPFSQEPSVEKDIVRTILEEHEIRQSFDLSRRINLEQPTLLRGINWYRKALYTEDPIDRFLAYWNSISVIAAKYHSPNERTKAGIINQIWDCFSTLWGGDVEGWPVIQGDLQWINHRNAMRNNIAHGVIPIEIDVVENVVTLTSSTREVAGNFLDGYFERLGYWFYL